MGQCLKRLMGLERFWDQRQKGLVNVHEFCFVFFQQKFRHKVMNTMLWGQAVGGSFWLIESFWNTVFRRSSCQGLCSAIIYLCPDASHSWVLLPSDTTSAGGESSTHSPSRHTNTHRISIQYQSPQQGKLLCHPSTDDVFHPIFINTSSRKAEGQEKKQNVSKYEHACHYS